ncbi:hypothetical protein GUITHDRAFT_158215 [Guillardia theta CCMP2712]|uniref:AB hydrolase-1 domain-containing protein n=1 Tax=Guillardia theta (strain CCMP2712) TaxID=905079 RepID=L1IZK6_GUITC|nr:hypothetical protein GUITHDRAFT_158215 [Guillardia theta CCMP2712]EKX41522.1 hypothetical protein GUITHDRAFT_158215 [Guillardia theta CCMP2712]|eukprot:XP_005828502.1 hypothetical protein GUITHDRAFT_158215 [Guillardia theta CCMP2712]
MITKEHFFLLPLRHDHSNGGQLEVFVRELVLSKNKDRADLPSLVFLQGGPGFQAGRPVTAESGWMKRALEEYRVFLLDQRGTGRSSPITHETLTMMKDPGEQAEYVSLMRADNIVKDCEEIRKLGQSFGGFCVLSYLSLAPQGLKEAIITGGLAPADPIFSPAAGRDGLAVYRATYDRVAARSEKFYLKYPQHVATVRQIVELLDKEPQRLPGGGVLTARRFLQLGLCLGSGSGFEHMHYLLEDPWLRSSDPSAGGKSFLKAVEDEMSYETNPLYAIAHETIYCSGVGASKWSAQRIMQERKDFDYKEKLRDPKGKIYFTAEHIFDWMYDDYLHLQGLKPVAALLASKQHWTKLYDKERLNACQVPTAAAVYYDDMYVERRLSEQTAQEIGCLPGAVPIKTWITNEYQHSAIRDDGYRVLDVLLGMLRGSKQIPS